MAKPKARFVCQSCGTVHPKWGGQCEGCNEWNTLEEQIDTAPPKAMKAGKGQVLDFVGLATPQDAPPRCQTGLSELDRVLGGGLVAGSAILIGGDPGIGKSTLLLQAAAALATDGTKVAYVSGEESTAQVQLRAERLGLKDADVQLAAGNAVRDIITALDVPNGPQVAVIDSVQTLFVDTVESAPGTVTQVRASSQELIRLAKRRNIALILVGHVTKDGQIAGPRVLEHMVDTVLYFEGDRGHQFRILRATKNRFGATDEIGVFRMTDLGLQQEPNPSALFLSHREVPVSGSVVFAGMEGSRPVLVEIQALVNGSSMATPRRAVVGWDSARLAMILAVLESRCGIPFSDQEVYLNVAGGMRVQEPAADLAVAAALLSALRDRPFPSGSVLFGEVGLSGEVRAVARSEMRAKEAHKLGFERIFCAVPSAKGKADKAQLGLGITPIGHVQTLLECFD